MSGTSVCACKRDDWRPCSKFGLAKRVRQAETLAMGVEGERLCQQGTCPCHRFAKIHASQYPILSAQLLKELHLLQDVSESVQGMTWLQSRRRWEF